MPLKIVDIIFPLLHNLLFLFLILNFLSSPIFFPFIETRRKSLKPMDLAKYHCDNKKNNDNLILLEIDKETGELSSF